MTPRLKKGKNIFKSKTFWLNVASSAAAIASGELGFALSPHIAIPVVAAANIANRFLTDEPVRLPSRTPAP